MKKLLPLIVLVCASATLVAGAYGKTGGAAAPEADPGVTATSVTIGGSVPLSGIASAYASVGRGAAAYFQYVNAHGGVNGRRIVYKLVDDAYDPNRTIQATKQLVEQDKVFAIYNTLGTETNLAVEKYLNQLKVPQLFVATGASTFGRDFKDNPWTIGYQLSYITEGGVYGDYIRRTRPTAAIGILYQDDDYGKDLITGLKHGLRSSGRIVAQQGYAPTDTDVQSQIASLKGSGANTLVLFATPKYAIQSFLFADKLGWKPEIIVNAVSSASNVMFLASDGGKSKRTEGAISVAFVKDPNDPQWAKDPGIKLYRSIMKQYARGQNPRDVYNAYAMASAYTLVDTLRKAGRNLTREGVMKAARSLNESANPFLLPGVKVKTSATDGFPIQQAKLEQYSKGLWRAFGPLVAG